MKVLQSRSFEQRVKKFNPQEKTTLDKVIRKLLENLSIGEEKKGDLRGVFVYKFNLRRISMFFIYGKASNKFREAF